MTEENRLQQNTTAETAEDQDRRAAPQLEIEPSPSYASKMLISLLLVLVTLAAYGQVRHYEFVNYDDNEYVSENERVRSGLTLDNVLWVFKSTRSSNWHPLTWLSHMLDCQLYGLDPGRHHLTNLLFHVANTLLLFLILCRMTGMPWQSGLVAALFALHPLHVESVAWVSERKDVLSAFFWMLTMGAYVRYAERPGLGRYLLVLLSFALGLLSKPMVVTLPFVLLLLDYWPLGRLQFNPPSPPFEKGGWGRLILEKLPFFFLSACSSVVTFLAQRIWGSVITFEEFPLSHRLPNALVSYASYIEKMIWPDRLAVLYPYPGMWPLWQVAGAGLFLVCISALVIPAAKKHPYLLVGWLWYLGTLFPVIGLVQVGPQALADRYTYLPLIGLFIMIAYGLPNLARRRFGRLALVLSASLTLFILMIVTRVQVGYWQNATTLFEHTLRVAADNPIIHNNLGVALLRKGRTLEAVAHFNQALRINPYETAALLNLRDTFARRESDIAEAVRNTPQDIKLRLNLGSALAHQGKNDEAMIHLTEALKIKADDADVRHSLGTVLFGQGKINEAVEQYKEALRMRPGYAETHNSLGNALATQGKIEEASGHYAEALKVEPSFAEAHCNLGVILARQGKTNEAISEFSIALKIKPNYPEAHNNLGVVFSLSGNIDEAISHFSKALSGRPDFADAHANLGNALATQGRIQEAVPHFKEVVRLRPALAQAHFSLAMAYLATGSRGAALKEYDVLKGIHPDMAKTLYDNIQNVRPDKNAQ